MRPFIIDVAAIIIIVLMIIIIIIIIKITRPKPAYGWQGLDWIVGPGYRFLVLSQPDFGSKRGN